MTSTPHFFKAAARHLLKKRADLLRNEISTNLISPVTSPVKQWFKDLFTREEKPPAPEPEPGSEGTEPTSAVATVETPAGPTPAVVPPVVPPETAAPPLPVAEVVAKTLPPPLQEE